MSDLTTLIANVQALQDDVTVIVSRYDDILNATENVVIDITGDITDAAEWAVYPEDTLIPAPNGNGTTDYSSLHWAKKSQASATASASSATASANSASQAATSATNAASSESSVATNAGLAQTSATNAATSASNAGTSATNASSSATAAAADAAQVAADKITVANDKATVASDKAAAANSATVAAGHASTATLRANDAADSALAIAGEVTLANKWATEAEDVVVSGGQYSAYHWAQKAASAVFNADVANKLGVNETAADSALLGGLTPAHYLAWANLTGKPTTLAGYGITDSIATSISELAGVNLTGIIDGQALVYDDATSTFVPQSITFSETDPVFTAHVASGITALDLTNWDTAFGWGDHDLAGYVLRDTNNVQIGSSFTGPQGSYSVAIGSAAAETGQSSYCVALGPEAGRFNQSQYGIAIGHEAGYENQGDRAIAIGEDAGRNFAGIQSIAIGSNAGYDNLADNAIEINSSGTSYGATAVGDIHILSGSGSAHFTAASGWEFVAGTTTVLSISPTGILSAPSLQIGDWNTAFGWGDHSLAGYLTSFTESDPTVPAHVKAVTSADIINWNAAYAWGDHGGEGYLTAETDPVFSAHVASGILAGDITNWNTAFGWGNHASAGYLTSYSVSQTDVTQHQTALTITKSQIPDFGSYEPAFTKNGGFNKPFGTTVNTVVQGNDSRVINGQTAYGWGNHALAGYSTTDTTYSAGANLNLVGTTFSLPTALTGMTDIATSNLSIGSWDIQLDGNDLRFRYGGVDKFRITTAGAVIAAGDVQGGGTP